LQRSAFITRNGSPQPRPQRPPNNRSPVRYSSPCGRRPAFRLHDSSGSHLRRRRPHGRPGRSRDSTTAGDRKAAALAALQGLVGPLRAAERPRGNPPPQSPRRCKAQPPSILRISPARSPLFTNASASPGTGSSRPAPRIPIPGPP
jgi:hypothetical protein